MSWSPDLGQTVIATDPYDIGYARVGVLLAYDPDDARYPYVVSGSWGVGLCDIKGRYPGVRLWSGWSDQRGYWEANVRPLTPEELARDQLDQLGQEDAL